VTKKAFINALLAELYIVIVVSVMNYGQATVKPADTIFIPIAMLSLFVLSAAVMGYLFLSQPIQLCLDGEKKHAVNLFLSTVIIFAIITGAVLLTLFFGLLQ
jgi:hypothetical protein